MEPHKLVKNAQIAPNCHSSPVLHPIHFKKSLSRLFKQHCQWCSCVELDDLGHWQVVGHSLASDSATTKK